MTTLLHYRYLALCDCAAVILILSAICILCWKHARVLGYLGVSLTIAAIGWTLMRWQWEREEEMFRIAIVQPFGTCKRIEIFGEEEDPWDTPPRRFVGDFPGEAPFSELWRSVRNGRIGTTPTTRIPRAPKRCRGIPLRMVCPQDREYRAFLCTSFQREDLRIGELVLVTPVQHPRSWLHEVCRREMHLFPSCAFVVGVLWGRTSTQQ